MLEEYILFLNQVIDFFQLISDDDGDVNVVREFIGRRYYIFDELFLQHLRMTRQQINSNREVYFTTYVGTWLKKKYVITFVDNKHIDNR
jgi:hypothetical protein